MSLSTYLGMLSYMRPHGSQADRLFRDRYLLNLPDAWQDAYGNIHVETDTASRVLFSAHTDTVHRVSGRQTIHHDAREGYAMLSKRSRSGDSNCLGADNTTGCYLLREMILAGIPGYYIFHYGEESGGIGSGRLAENDASWLADRFTYAIAFDRRGCSDIITHQCGYRTASDAFAKSLADMLRLPLKPAHGVYTDTYEYAHIIPECSNVSVGYAFEHSAREEQDTEYLAILRDRLLHFSEGTLQATREPAADTFVDVSEYAVGSLVSAWDARSSWNRYDGHYLNPEYAEVVAALRSQADLICFGCGCPLSERSLFDETCMICGMDLR